MKKPKKGKGPSPRNYGRIPNRLLYSASAFLLKYIVKPFFHVDWVVDPRIRELSPPFLVLGNHPSYLDPFLVACALYPMKINFLASDSFFRNKLLEPFLFRGGVIPKTQFRADPGAIKAMLRVVLRNGVLGIFPEGARSIDGTSLPIEDSISKLAKKIGGGIIVGLSHGAYLTWPRWSMSKFRRGCIQIELSILLTKEEVASLTPIQIHENIIHALAFNESAWQKDRMIPYKTKAPAKGLHNILHQCPRCRKSWITETTSDKLICKACGNTAVMDPFGFLNPLDTNAVVFQTVKEWNDWQIGELSPLVLLEGYHLADDTELLVSELESPYVPSGKGTILLDKNGFSFTGTLNGQQVQKHFPLAGVLGISSDYGFNFDLVSDRHTYRFVLQNGQKAITFTHALDLLRKNASAAKHVQNENRISSDSTVGTDI